MPNGRGCGFIWLEQRLAAQWLEQRLAAQSMWPTLELGISESDVPRAVERIPDWMEATGGIGVGAVGLVIRAPVAPHRPSPHPRQERA
jgi:hypothetical protein